ncbi:hypothetical protein SCLCIDRAFT_29719 [Scleroderma citrinum Foug A]|uniref:Uncharacterized protein n=1 Tax=Scleroderma citrinum Foug A TaxID=1036808 RepID=A0A0C2Z2Z5_9AGAM|nr:hypothetical protein SCLCIDRAFT_29719 [Scleroderma citrinum Foug A]
MAPDTWGKASTSARQFIHSTIEKKFSFFKFAEDGWKLDYLCTHLYPSWRSCRLDANGSLKKNVHNTVKEEASDEDKDLADHKPVIIKKRKGHADTLQPSSKKQKVENMPDTHESIACRDDEPRSERFFSYSLAYTHIEIPVHDFRPSEEEDTPEQSRDSEEPRTIHSTESAVHPMESNTLGTLPTQASTSQPERSANKENMPVVNNVPATHSLVSYDPMLLLAGAASKVKVATVPPIPDPPKPCPAGPSHLLDKRATNSPSDGSGGLDTTTNNTTAKAKVRLRPSGTKNGRNLCMLRWLKQVNTNGQKDEFRAYYDKTLIPAQCKAYDKEAKELVDTNGWSKVVIKTGKLY